MRESGKQNGIKYAQFSLVGGSNALVDFGVLNLLLLLWPTRSPELLVAFNTVALVLTNGNSYLWNTLWTFRRQARHDARQVGLFGAQGLLNVAVGGLLIWLVAHGLLAYTSLSPLAGGNVAKVVSMIAASTMSFVLLPSSSSGERMPEPGRYEAPGPKEPVIEERPGMLDRGRGDKDPNREPGQRRETRPRRGPDRRITAEPLIDVDGREEETRPKRAEDGRRKARGSSAEPDGKPGAGLYGSDVGANMARAAVAEIVGAFILVYTGTAVAVAAILERPAVGPPFDSLAVPLAFGLVLVALVAAVGHVSGAHLNPAVTLSLAATGKFPWNHVPAYLAAQLTGAVLAAFATWITLGGAARGDAALAAPTLAPGVGVLQGFVVEALITFILVFVVISVATDERVPKPVAPVAVGFALAAGVFIGGPVTGGSVNPARALGPIIVAWENWSTALIYVLAPIVGGVLAAVLYDRFISEAKTPDEDDAS